MGDTAAAPQNFQNTYLDVLKQPSAPLSYEVALHPLPIGWGMHARDYNPPETLIHEPNMLDGILEELETLLGNLTGPESASDMERKLKLWRNQCAVGSTLDRTRTLCTTAAEVANDIRLRLPLLHQVSSQGAGANKPSVVPAHCQTSVPASTTWFRYEQLASYEVKSVVNHSPTERSAVTVVGLDVVSAERTFPCLVRRANENFQIDLKGFRSPEASANGLIHLIAHHFASSNVRYVLLISPTISVLLKSTRSASNQNVLHCSDILSHERSHLLLSVLVSLQLTNKESIAESGCPAVIQRHSLKLPSETSKKGLDELLTNNIILGFAPPGVTSIHEHYLLGKEEASKGKEISTQPEAKSTNKYPIIVATSKIGFGTCGTVYLGSYGHQQLAVKLALLENGKENCLTQEFDIYDRIRRAGLDGTVAPRCYGLFRCKEMAILITAYSGLALASFDLSIEDRLSIFRAARALEDAGIEQGSFGPRNVVCDDNKVFRIIDFHRGIFRRGRKSDLHRMKGDYWDVRKHYQWTKNEPLILDWMHVVPLPETDDSNLAEGYEPKQRFSPSKLH